jgi:site-specific DNA-methyltransferase (adenine-specific)
MTQELWLGDCLELMKNIPNGSVDMVLTSPPYDNLRTYNGSLEWGEHIWKPVIKQLFEIVKDGGVVVWVVGDATIKGSETGTSFKQALYFMECGFNLHDTMIYEKNNFANPSSNRYHQTIEYMFVFCKGKIKTFNPIKDKKNIYVGQKAHGKNRSKDGWKENTSGQTRNEFGMRHNIWRYTTGGGHMATDEFAHQHPAIFPENLANDHISSWSNEGDMIVDIFMGSGTTIKMAIKLNRQVIGIEKEEEYYNIAVKRLDSQNR